MVWVAWPPSALAMQPQIHPTHPLSPFTTGKQQGKGWRDAVSFPFPHRISSLLSFAQRLKWGAGGAVRGRERTVGGGHRSSNENYALVHIRKGFLYIYSSHKAFLLFIYFFFTFFSSVSPFFNVCCGIRWAWRREGSPRARAQEWKHGAVNLLQ
jgi:hypothetical protein